MAGWLSHDEDVWGMESGCGCSDVGGVGVGGTSGRVGTPTQTERWTVLCLARRKGMCQAARDFTSTTLALSLSWLSVRPVASISAARGVTCFIPIMSTFLSGDFLGGSGDILGGSGDFLDVSGGFLGGSGVSLSASDDFVGVSGDFLDVSGRPRSPRSHPRHS